MIGKSERTVSSLAADLFGDWLQRLDTAFASHDVDRLVEMFAPTGHWKDFLSFTWEHRVFSGPADIRVALAATLRRVRPRAVRLSPNRAVPRLGRRSAHDVLEGFFDFDTLYGRATGFVRLFHDQARPNEPKVWLMLTALQELHDHPEAVGRRRPSFDQYAQNTTPTNWLDDRRRSAAYAERDPEVLVVGAGHAGMILAARLGLLGVDTLVIDREQRVGDTWRKRYHSLTLHNESMANHLPFMPFPETWPVWLPKDKLAGWLEAYAEAMELNVWTGTSLCDASFDETAKIWKVQVRRDGQVRELRCRHLVVAVGVSGSIPCRPEIPGLADFAGEVRHSSEYSSGRNYQGKHAIVIGTGNSAHDVAQDLVLNGAARVSILQRSPTCVVSLKPSATMVYSVYTEGPAVEDVDLMTAAIPYPVLFDTYKYMTRRHSQLDADLIERLNRAGFETYYGADDTGFHMMYLRGEGGYYINVGCSDLIIEGKVGVLQARDTAGFVADGLRRKDGSVVPADLVVLATGFENMQEGVRAMLGDTVAERVGPIWGFDEDEQMRAMWRRTGQENLWIMGGALIEARLHSRFLALEIRAALDGILPAPHDLPWVPRRAGAAVTA